MWITDNNPRIEDHYLVTIERPNQSRFVGYAYWDGNNWLTQNKAFRMRFCIVGWMEKPAPCPEHVTQFLNFKPVNRYGRQ